MSGPVPTTAGASACIRVALRGAGVTVPQSTEAERLPRLALRHPVCEPPYVMTDFDLVPPRADALMESLRATGYSLPDAVADLIDNSITAGARNIWLDFHWGGADSRVSILDDGCGMSEPELVAAMKVGSEEPPRGAGTD